MSSQKEQIDKGTYFSQLINKTSLQLVRDALEQFGYTVEFIRVKNLDSKKLYGKGIDRNLMRDVEFLQSVVNDEEGASEELVQRVKKTVVIFYTYTPMNITPMETGFGIASQGNNQVNKNKYLVGYQYVNTIKPTQESGVVKDFDEVFAGGSQLTEFSEIKPPKSSEILDLYRDEAMEQKGYTLAKIIKDRVYVSFGVQMSLLTASESDLHNIQFILLRKLYTDVNTEGLITNKIDYTFDKAKIPITREFSYKVSELTGVDSIGEANSGLYNIGLSFEGIKAELFSDYSYLVPIQEDLPVEVLFKVGIAPLTDN